MITMLILLIFVAVLLQPNASRFYAAFLFAGATITHDLALSHLNGFAYYASAALFDLGIIALTSGINPIPKMVISLHRICMVSILLNFAGWLMWLFYLSPFYYDTMFALVYSWALIIMLLRNKTDVGDFTMPSWYSCFRFDLLAWNKTDSKNINKTQP
tara:strand:- start:308 stop:781 length:474 start_codon:yes stop_codon:yes gene_type:complete